ncbi:MAG: hypothetical protein Athens071416_400 [Parcubacteria group bacterium Athens0714_16]|nr:MAG: hypothetical protein Athens071416_400 [Parcubacteria group bacterium Athens0714_16]
MLRGIIKKIFKTKTFYVETNLKIISLVVEKTYPVFAGTLNDKTSKQMPFVVGKTEYGPVKIPISEKTHKALWSKISFGHNKIRTSVPIKLKIRKTKEGGHTEFKILAGKVISEIKKE